VDKLTVLVLVGSKSSSGEIRKQLETFPRVKILTTPGDPEDFIFRGEIKPDCIMADLQGLTELPAWLAQLTQRFPHTPVMVCSDNSERQFLIRAMQLGVREFLALPLVRTELEVALERVFVAQTKRLAEQAGAGKVVAVSSLKGGVGVTSVAVNLAVALAENYPERVALVDLGRPFPDVANFLHQPKKASLLDLLENQDHLDPSFIMGAMQFHNAKMAVLHGCSNFKGLDLMKPAALEKIWGNLRQLFTWTVVDLGHWLDEVYLSTANAADRVILLTELTIPDLHHLRELWILFREQGLKMDRVSVVVNRYNSHNGVGLKDLESINHQPVFCTLPSDYKTISESINLGVPLAEKSPKSKLYRSLQGLAEELIHACQMESGAEPKPRRRFFFF
jgi:pilus assembly protein CpaE